ncbi:MAG: beta-N-acetylhexosaminidase [Sphingobacteriia bacterium]|nr:MAG: beta-N-acetylhexosaminidase [Sphingobacteriia bacterium]
MANTNAIAQVAPSPAPPNNSLPALVPLPQSLKSLPGEALTKLETLVFPANLWAEAQYLAAEIAQQTGKNLSLVKADQTAGAPAGALVLSWSTTPLAAEGYRLQVQSSAMTLVAQDKAGFIHGMQTILQLLPLQKGKAWKIPALEIEDHPRFAYRGMHLDVVRHLFSVDYIKQFIDYLCHHKMNTFHWHLTDDQGWRIEMKAYPKLNTIGSYRAETLVGHFKDQPAVYDGQRYGGYYTQKEIKEIVAYAALRQINIIPEIDIPGHSRAAIAAYPELSTQPDTVWNVATTWGMYNRQNNVLAPKPATFQFLETVFTELMALFPSPYIHLGGDECSKLWWKQDPKTQDFIAQNKLGNETGLQTYFIEYVGRFLQTKGRKAIGWHEIAEGKLDTATLIMNWGNEKTAAQCLQKGFSIIQTPGKPLYFDHYQSLDPKDSLAIHGYNPLEAVYRFDPVPPGMNRSNKILGAQANVWTEYMGHAQKVNYMVFPRMTALSEVLWSGPGKDYGAFLQRLESQSIPRYGYWNASWFKDYRKWDLSKKPAN